MQTNKTPRIYRRMISQVKLTGKFVKKKSLSFKTSWGMRPVKKPTNILVNFIY